MKVFYAERREIRGERERMSVDHLLVVVEACVP